MANAILVTGASGNVGRPLVAALLAQGEAVKAGSRSGKAVDGAAGVVLDLDDPSTFEGALAGVDRAFVMLPPSAANPHDRARPLLEAAAARKVKVVLMSVAGADADEANPYRQLERELERNLERSGTAYVVLRPNWFADNFHTFWKPGIDHGVIAVPAADGKTSFIDARDIAASAAAALTSSRFDGQAFTLTGPQALDYGEAAAILSKVTGKAIAYTPVDDDAFVGILTGAGLPPDYARFLAAIFVPVRLGHTAVVSGDVAKLTGHAPRTLETYAQDHAAALK